MGVIVVSDVMDEYMVQTRLEIIALSRKTHLPWAIPSMGLLHREDSCRQMLMSVGKPCQAARIRAKRGVCGKLT
jgi:hypothetical protein